MIVINGVKISSPGMFRLPKIHEADFLLLFFFIPKHPKSVEFTVEFPGGYLTPPVGLGLGTLEAWDGLQGLAARAGEAAGSNQPQPINR